MALQDSHGESEDRGRPDSGWGERRGPHISAARSMPAPPRPLGKRDWVRLAIAGAILCSLAIVAWRFWPRDISQRTCRHNLATLYIAAVHVQTGQNPEPPAPVPGEGPPPSPRALPELSAGQIPALEDVFSKLVTDFHMTPDDNRYLQLAWMKGVRHAGWSYRTASASALACPADPIYERKSGYFDNARSWTSLRSLPPSSYIWNPEPDVVARCPFHFLDLMRDGSLRQSGSH